MEASNTGAPQEQAKQAAGQAQEKAQQAAGQAKDQVRTQVDQRSTQAGEQVATTATDIRSVADHLREQGKDQPAKYAEQAADRAERLGSYLQESDADRILGDVEQFARRQPMAVVLGGLAAGFVASRMLKASSQQRHATGGNGNGTSSDHGAQPQVPRTQLPPTTSPSSWPAGQTGTPVDLASPERSGAVTSDVSR